MTETLFYPEDLVVGKSKLGRKLGTVSQVHGQEAESDSDDIPDLETGYVAVEWYPDGNRQVLSESKLSLVDRSILPRDVVRLKNGNQLGTVMDIKVTCDAVIVGTGKKLKNIKATSLQQIMPFLEGDLISYGPWLGRIRHINRNLLVRFSNGSRGYVSVEAGDVELMEDIFPHPSDDGAYADPEYTFYPGQALVGPHATFENIHWIEPHSNLEPKASHKVLVEKVEPAGVEINWIQFSCFSQAASSQTFAELGLSKNPQEPPPVFLQGDKLKWIKCLKHFWTGHVVLGNRFCYLLGEDEVNDLNKKPVRRKRKMRRNVLTSQSTSSIGPTRNRYNRTLKAIQSAHEQGFPSSPVHLTASDDFLYDGDEVSTGEDDSEDRGTTQVETNAVTSSNSQQHIHFQVENLSVEFDEVDGRDFVAHVKMNKMCQNDLAELSKACFDRESVLNPGVEKIFEKITSQFNLNTVTDGLVTLKSKQGKVSVNGVLDGNQVNFWFNENAASNQSAGSNDKPAPKISFQAGAKAQYVAHQIVSVEITATKTHATIEWQNGEKSVNVVSTAVQPAHHIDDNDFCPGDFVSDERHKGSTSGGIYKYGLILKADNENRMATVKWFSIEHNSINQLNTEEMSVYELADHPDFRFRVGDIVFRLGEFDRSPTFNQHQVIGEMLKVTQDGKLRVVWTDESVSEVYPQEVLLVSIDDDNSMFDDEFDDDDAGSDVSWETTDEEEVEDSAGLWEELVNAGGDGGGLMQVDPLEHDPIAIITSTSVDPPPPPVESSDDLPSIIQRSVESDDLYIVTPISEQENSVFMPDDEEDDENEQFGSEASTPTSHKFVATEFHPINMKRFQQAQKRDFKLLKTSLPPGIFVRTYEDRMDLVSVMIAGPDRTPYQDGLFMFDVQFPGGYPDDPPSIHYISYSPRLNPNLYESGKVCVSLLGTWVGKGNEKWTKDSNFLQVLVSIQGLILNSEPYYNEAGYEGHRGTQEGKKNSRCYNEMVTLRMVQHMTSFIAQPPQAFLALSQRLLRTNLPRFIHRMTALLSADDDDVDVKTDRVAISNDDVTSTPDDVANDAATSNNDVTAAINDVIPAHDDVNYPLLPLSKGVVLSLKERTAKLSALALQHNLLAPPVVAATAPRVSDSNNNTNNEPGAK